MRFLALIAVVLASATAETPSRAQADADAARRAKVAVKVGSRAVTVGELDDRLAGIPPFQLATFGASRDAVVRAYVDQVIVRDLLLSAGAEQRGLARELPTKHMLERTLSTATLRAAHKDIPSGPAIPMDDVRRYYEENRARFDSPERINVWRILCKTQQEAATVLEAAKRDPGLARFNDLAREHSLDKATNLRGGNLGFVGPDGASNEAGLKVDPALLRAVSTVKDGELAPQPVTEGAYSAVVWRRATVPATRRSVDEAAAQIRTTIHRERIEAADKKLIDDLRAKQVKNVDYDLLRLIDIPVFDAGVTIPRSAPRSPSAPDAH